jgi:putative SOS response-associated peptidase YedK
MCGRFSFSIREKIIEDNFGIELSDLSPHYNCAPGQQLAVVLFEQNQYSLKYFKWGLIPFWAKEPSIGNKMINAKAETITEKPSFKQAIKKRRCLIPADSFYEWSQDTEKIPYRIFVKGKEMFSMAGIWDIWSNPSGEMEHSFSVITTEANDFMRPIHHRMPVIFATKEKERLWLQSDSDAGYLRLLQTGDLIELESYTISKKVNSPRNDDASIHERYNYPLIDNKLKLN